MATPAPRTELPVTLADVEAAAARIAGAVTRTPTLLSRTLSERTGATVHVKFENMQHTGAYKERGALNKLLLMDQAARARGVIAASAGNHSQAVAYHASRLGVPAVIVMPTPTPVIKVSRTEGHGAEVILHGETFDEAYAEALRVADARGLTFVHPFDDFEVMAGQGTVALELLADAPDIDLIVVPIGGGGLISGIGAAAKGLKPGIRVVGVEPAGADDAYRSFKSGAIVPMPNPDTIADGLRGALGDKTFDVISHCVDDVVTVSEAAICRAMRTLWEVLKIIVEPSAAVPYAALVERKIDVGGKRVGIILSGGNLDLDSLPWISNEVL